MDSVLLINLILGVTWATLFMYLLVMRNAQLHKQEFLQEEFSNMAYRLMLMRNVWTYLLRVAEVCIKADVPPQEKEKIEHLLKIAKNLMEGADE